MSQSTAIERARQVARFTRRGFEWGPEQVELLRQLCATTDPDQIAQVFGVSEAALRSKVAKLRFRFGTRWKRQGHSYAARNTSVSTGYFEAWSPNMAYILGYIWADGCIQKPRKPGQRPTTLCFEVTESDRCLLESIRSEMCATAPLVVREGKTNTLNGKPIATKNSVTMRVGSATLVESLMSLHGIGHRKSFNDYPYPKVPDEFLCHFARGNFDGDGCVWSRSRGRAEFGCFWLGTPKFAQGLCEAIEQATGIKPAHLRLSGMLFRFDWGDKVSILKLRQWLYPPGDYIFLARKREKFDLAAELLAGVIPHNRRREQTRAGFGTVDLTGQ